MAKEKAYKTMTGQQLLEAPWGTRVADTEGDIWRKQGGTDSWKMETGARTRTTSYRLADLWGPVVLMPED